MDHACFGIFDGLPKGRDEFLRSGGGAWSWMRDSERFLQGIGILVQKVVQDELDAPRGEGRKNGNARVSRNNPEILGVGGGGFLVGNLAGKVHLHIPP